MSLGLLGRVLCDTMSMPESQDVCLIIFSIHKMNSSATEGNEASLTQLVLDKTRLTCFISFYFLNACKSSIWLLVPGIEVHLTDLQFLSFSPSLKTDSMTYPPGSPLGQGSSRTPLSVAENEGALGRGELQPASPAAAQHSANQQHKHGLQHRFCLEPVKKELIPHCMEIQSKSPPAHLSGISHA